MEILDPATLHEYLAADAFEQMSAFGALSQSFVAKLLADGEVLKLTAGETLYRKGDTAESFFVLLSGQITVYEGTDGGKDIIRTMKAGESVGFPAMIALRPRRFSGDAADDCIVVKVSSEGFADLYIWDPKQFAIFFMCLSRDMSRFLSDTAGRPGKPQD
ncbi:cyclic nucleotide-binding domain-containing protein [Polaromonas sp. P1(28)-13]|nr:cyclic nucleotide-binding domain-containing protein [Polaromonas sp. P1(28)-13]